MNTRRIVLPVLLTLALTSGCTPAPSPRSAATTSPSKALGAESAAATPEAYLATLTVDAESVAVYAEASRNADAVSTLRSGDRLRLIERRPDWLFVKTLAGVRGWVEPASLVSPTCTTDRREPVVLEEPVFRFSLAPPHGAVVVEAEYSGDAELVSARVVRNGLGDPRFEKTALEDLRGLRFLPPTSGCRGRAFFYTFTRRF